MATEALLSLRAVSKHFPGEVIGLDTVTLDVAAGEFLTLLGPSGCGKTTSLRVMAGFVMPSSGQVLLEGKDITDLRPNHRPVNTVFQDYALFPHMTVAENVAFGLSLRKLSATEQKRRVAAALDMVGLADKLRSRVQELSGGQRQRVALARAIVCEPRVLLLDEPLSALDAHLREQMQVELKRLQSRLGMTFVMVTHDQTEALSISDRIVVMNRGRIEQVASPAELYDRPATSFVARFIGTMNLLEAIDLGPSEAGRRFKVADLPLELTGGEGAMSATGDRRAIGIRPEDLIISRTAAEGAAPVRIQSIVFHGRTLRLHADMVRSGGTEGVPVVIDAPRQSDSSGFQSGETAYIHVRRGASCPVLPL